MGVAATEAAFSKCDAWIDELMNCIEKNYQLVCNFFASHVPEVKVAQADSTYFAWIDMRSLCIDSRKLCYLIETEEHLVVESGLTGGKGGAGFIRLNLATTENNVNDALARLKHFCDSHSH